MKGGKRAAGFRSGTLRVLVKGSVMAAVFLLSFLIPR